MVILRYTPLDRESSTSGQLSGFFVYRGYSRLEFTPDFLTLSGFKVLLGCAQKNKCHNALSTTVQIVFLKIANIKANFIV